MGFFSKLFGKVEDDNTPVEKIIKKSYEPKDIKQDDIFINGKPFQGLEIATDLGFSFSDDAFLLNYAKKAIDNGLEKSYAWLDGKKISIMDLALLNGSKKTITFLLKYEIPCIYDNPLKRFFSNVTSNMKNNDEWFETNIEAILSYLENNHLYQKSTRVAINSLLRDIIDNSKQFESFLEIFPIADKYSNNILRMRNIEKYVEKNDIEFLDFALEHKGWKWREYLLIKKAEPNSEWQDFLMNKMGEDKFNKMIEKNADKWGIDPLDYMSPELRELFVF